MRALASIMVSLVAVILGVAACSPDSSRPPPLPDTHGDAQPGTLSNGIADPCAVPAEGCSCTPDGVKSDCGEVTRRSGDYVTCSVGKRTCSGGTWGACIGDSIATKRVAVASLHPTNLGAQTVCAQNICDPACNEFLDTPAGLDAGPAFTGAEGGITLAGQPVFGITCTGLTVSCATSPATVPTTITVTSLTPSNATAQCTAALLPSGCFSGPFPTSWGVNLPAQATVSSTGLLSVPSPFAGSITVTAFANGTSASATVAVVTNILDTSYAPSGEAAAYAASPCLRSPNIGPNLTWLYPYDSTYFPLGLVAPLPQYVLTSGAPAAASVKLSLQYPAVSPTFVYSTIVPENNPPILPGGITPPAAQQTAWQTAWQAFTLAAAGGNGVISVTRHDSGVTCIETPSTHLVHLVNGQLKGTVYYNSYNSQVAGGSTGAVLSINTSTINPPTLAISSKAGSCQVCHSVSADGSTLIAQNSDYDSASSFSMASGGTKIADYPNTGGGGNGDKLDWGAVYPDGTMVVAHSKNGYHAYGSASQLFPTNQSSPAAISVTNWSSDTQAVTPAFSSDGRLLAFNFWSGTDRTGNRVSPGSGQTLDLVNFACGASTGRVTCGAPPYSVSNMRQLVSVGGGQYVGWPSFLPDGSGVIYQNTIRATNPGDGSPLYTWEGALSELWLVNASGAPVPVRLSNLDGSGTPKLPEVTNYPLHVTGNTIAWPKSGGASGSSGAANEEALNYMPTIAPQPAGGEFWVVFTSRRLYGNVATGNPWLCEECGTLTVPPTKKLWVAAVDQSWTPGTDPSHPAFYLPNQELLAGNMRGFWSQSPCSPAGNSSASLCTTDADCCGGTSSPQTAACRIDVASSPLTRHCQSVNANACAGTGGSCSVDSDCCVVGAHCLAGACAVAVGYPVSATMTRLFTASCPTGTRVVWRFFDWEATETTDDHINFSAQTSDDPSAVSSVPSVTLGRAQAPSNASFWIGADVSAALSAANLTSANYLLVSMQFVPAASELYAPVLVDWRQQFDCAPSE